jgi:hypothetical protein
MTIFTLTIDDFHIDDCTTPGHAAVQSSMSQSSILNSLRLP